jgi:predicted HD phosphohydrolase
LFAAIELLEAEDLGKVVYIRNEGHTVMEAINRQIAHYAYHVGQVVFLAKAITTEWETLSIARNKSTDYNADKFSKDKGKRHFI